MSENSQSINQDPEIIRDAELYCETIYNVAIENNQREAAINDSDSNSLHNENDENNTDSFNNQLCLKNSYQEFISEFRSKQIDRKFIQGKGNLLEKTAFHLTSFDQNRNSYALRKTLFEELNSIQTGGPNLPDISRTNGYVVDCPKDWPALNKAINEARDCFDQLAPTGENPGKLFMRAMPRKRHDIQSAIIQLAIHPSILTVVSRYLGMLPVLMRTNVLYSENKTLDDGSSQFIHLDPEDIHQVKFLCI